MVKLPVSPYLKHKEKWANCKKCELCNYRRNVVSIRGSIPCDYLFIGEGPGEHEDLRGIPFFGPAGHLLNDMIALSSRESLKLAFANVVGCIPKNETGKIEIPTMKSMKACSGKLKEIVKISNPKIIIAVGTVAKDWIPYVFPDHCLRNQVHHIIHPAAILKSKTFQKMEAKRKTEEKLAEIFESAIGKIVWTG